MEKPVVICGFPRSGSTLFYNALRSTVTNYRFFDKEQQALQIPKKYNFVSKRPKDCYNVKEIKEKFNPYFIFMVRDPRDVITSVHAHSEGQYKVGAEYSLKTGKKGVCGKTEGMLSYWKALKNMPEYTIFIYYEELVTDPDKVQNDLKKIFKYNGKFTDFHTKQIPPRLAHPLNGVRPISDSNIGRWVNHQKRVKDQFTKYPSMFKMLIELGYEKDTEWFA